ncbi:hypothetical protein [Arcticibacter tournemirensis]|uniref:Uncharacterized protein n=1 Tax=Arcticibacter tournemirensis TaxID=699437 RepID=A0A4V1KIM1_9SPHI|nr:hypothetical protein [Arcticibacter tournemirensis]RXF71172.1 hypothetical protein EKH83_05610 [Arcticibacter tournemirensis]
MSLTAFEQEWERDSANIIADLSYTKNLNEHFVTTQLAIKKLNAFMQTEGESQRLMLLGYDIYAINQQILDHIPYFAAKQRQQLLALSRGTIKEEVLYNITLANRSVVEEQDFLNSF